MRKLMILALVATLAVAGSAFAVGERGFGIAPNATFSNGNNPTTTNNDDSCEISVTPAATLLLPYFDVDTEAVAGTSDNTLFTITNVSRLAQIAHVTVWTDWSFPVLDFNIFLTPYDVQSINLFQVLREGVVGPNPGAGLGGPGTSSTSSTISPRGGGGTHGAFTTAFVNTNNPNLSASAVAAGGACSGQNLPGTLPGALVTAVRTALRTGIYAPNPPIPGAGCGATQVGSNNHGGNAVGYITIDVANTCSVNLPDNPAYMLNEILFDNVLIGDYQQIDGNPTVGNFAQGNPMVHIRAIPEGSTATARNPGTNLPFTFYDRYTVGNGTFPIPNRQFDRRQPLPSTFAARYIQAGGVTNFATNYKIWREGVTTGTQACSTAVNNSAMPVADIVRFDEIENAYGFAGGSICSPCPEGEGPRLPETSLTSTASSIYPALGGPAGTVAGWMYLNLNNGGTAGYSVAPRYTIPGPNPFAINGTIVRPSQNWVIVSMEAQARYSVDFDAAHLGNGCSLPAVDPATSTSIGPAGGVLVCPPFTICTDPAYSGTNVTP